MSATHKHRGDDLVITFPSQRRVKVNVWYILQDTDQDGDGVRGMFVREVDSQFCESDIAMDRSGGLESSSMSPR